MQPHHFRITWKGWPMLLQHFVIHRNDKSESRCPCRSVHAFRHPDFAELPGSRGFWHCAPHLSGLFTPESHRGGHLVLKSQRQQPFFSYTLQVTEHILRSAVRWNGECGHTGQQPFSLKSKEFGGAPTNEAVSDVT